MKFFNDCFIALVFIGVLSAPAVKHIISDDQLKSDENRILNQQPTWPPKNLNTFIDQSNGYLQDQFGFRNELIGLLNQIKYHFFKQVLSKQITVGKNDFLYFNSHSANYPDSLLKSVCGVSKPSKAFQNKTKKYFEDFIGYFRQKGINAHMAVVPTKSRIYPEKLPRVERSWCEKTTVKWRDELLSKINQDILYYPLNKMIGLKASVAVYLPKSFHWHGLLPNIIAMDIMSKLWNIKTEDHLKPDPIQVESDLRLQLKGLRFIEKSYSYDYSKIGAESCLGRHCISGIENVYKFAVVYHYKKSDAGNKLLLLTDSFGQYIAENFIRGFSEVLSIDTNNLKPTEQKQFYEWIIEEIQPTHLLYLIHDGGTFGQTVQLEYFFNKT